MTIVYCLKRKKQLKKNDKTIKKGKNVFALQLKKKKKKNQKFQITCKIIAVFRNVILSCGGF